MAGEPHGNAGLVQAPPARQQTALNSLPPFPTPTTMKTYAEAEGKEPFDWNAFLSKTSVTWEELLSARERARSWITCACGNQCDIIPRNTHGVPEDSILHTHGAEFSECLDRSYNCTTEKLAVLYFPTARAILAVIEKRSAELIAELTK